MLYTNDGEIKMLGESSEVLADIATIAYSVYDAMICAGKSKREASSEIFGAVNRAILYFDEIKEA